jgi:hypothetical protein
MTCKHLLCAILVMQSLAAGAAERAPEWARKLPEGKWVKIDTGNGSNRSNSAVFWLEKEKRFLILCGSQGISMKDVPRVYGIQTFDPVTRKWANRFPRGKEKAWAGAGLNCKATRFKRPAHPYGYMRLKDMDGTVRLRGVAATAGYSSHDTMNNKVYVGLAGHWFMADLPRSALAIMHYDVSARSWELISHKTPPAVIDYARQDEGNVKMKGTVIVSDPVNKELLFIGGHTAGAMNGSIGSWAYSTAKKKWRPMKVQSAIMDPLRGKALEAKKLARDCMAAARNVFYAGKAADREKLAVKATPDKLVAEALKQSQTVAAALGVARPAAWEKQAVLQAGVFVDKAVAALSKAGDGFSEGRLSAGLIKSVCDAAWALDQAADCLRTSPGRRVNASTAYDPKNEVIVLFGGDHFDYLTNDTWIYDCKEKRWQQVWPKKAPSPRAHAQMLWLPGREQLALIGGKTCNTRFTFYRSLIEIPSEIWTFDAAARRWKMSHREDRAKRKRVVYGQSSDHPVEMCGSLAAGAGDVLFGMARQPMGSRFQGRAYEFTTWLMRIGAPRPDLTLKHGVAGGGRSYSAVIPEYDPCWYDAAPRGDTVKAEGFLKSLKPNVWTLVPGAPRKVPQRDWGTAVYDSDRDQIYRWTGGHMADPSTIVSMYHPGINRWSIPYMAERPSGKGRTYNNRPDCSNHTYINYRYDPVSKRMVACSVGGTGVYNPDRREWDYMVDQPIRTNEMLYNVKTVGTPLGLVMWTGRIQKPYFGVFDVGKRKWKRLPLKGRLGTGFFHGDENTMTYDPKRNVIWLTAANRSGRKGTNGQVWRYDMKTGTASALNPRNMDTIGKQAYPMRETVYVPGIDMVLTNDLIAGKQAAYDPAKNRWVLLGIKRQSVRDVNKQLGGVSLGMTYDSKRKLIWGLTLFSRVFVLRLDPGTLKIEEQ